MNKRIMSFLLSLVMIFSMMVSAVPAYAAGPTQLKVTADKTEANPGDTLTFTITLGPVSDMGTMQMDLVIPEGLTYVANSAVLASGLKETLGFDTADWTEVTKRINGVASAADYSSSSDTVIATFKCTVNDDFSGTAKVGLNNLEFYSCQTWEDHTDDYSVVTADITVAAAHEHTFETKWTYDETNHWYASTCGHDVKSGEEEHHGGTATCTTKAVCEDCGQSYGALADHEYGTKIEAQPEVHTPTELKAGVKAHFYCDVCEKYFTEEKVETTLEDLTGKTPEHSYGEWVNTDPENHWKECSCGLKANEGKHAYDNILDAECNDCGHEREVVVPEVKLNKNVLELIVSSSDQLEAEVTPEGLEGYTLEWTSDATDVATVDENGKVTAVAKGEANITVTLVLGTLAQTTISDTCAVTVKEPEVPAPTTTSVTVTKEWDVPETFDREDLPESVSVVLMADGDSYGEPVTLNDENNWTCTWTELPVATEDGKAIEYEVDEVEVPEGYEKSIEKAEVPAGMGYVITNTLKETEPEIESYTVDFDTKGGSAVESQTIEEGGKVTKPADPTKEGFNFIKWTFEDKDWDFDYAVTGNMTLVAVWEEVEPEVPAITAVTVVKEWNAPEGTVLPESVEVYLLANGQEVTDSRTVLDEGNEWTYTWTELPVAEEDGTPIVYTVDEVEVEGYEKAIGEALETDTGIEIAITNTLIEEEPEVPETVTVAGTKTWVGDEEADRPESIIVNLLANGEVIDEAEVTARTQWTFYFDELPKYDEAGAEIEYSVEEEEVEGYTATYDGYNITNTLKEEEPEDPEKPVYGIVVKNGKSYTGAGVEISAAEEGTKITLKADAAPEGMEFDKWVVNNGTITLADATKAETTFDMPAERVEVTATYKDKVVTPPADDDNSDETDKPSDDNKEDESKPSDTNKPATDTESPKTGDTSNSFMWFAVLFVSGFALVGFLLFGKRRRA